MSLARIIVHVISDTTRHAGHADILREGIDGAAGLRVASTNLPDVDWPAYVAMLTAGGRPVPAGVAPASLPSTTLGGTPRRHG